MVLFAAGKKLQYIQQVQKYDILKIILTTIVWIVNCQKAQKIKTLLFSCVCVVLLVDIVSQIKKNRKQKSNLNGTANINHCMYIRLLHTLTCRDRKEKKKSH